MRLLACSCWLLALWRGAAAAAAGDAECHDGSDAGSEQCTDELGRFLEWLEEGGATLHPSLTVRPSAAGIRGLHATADLKEGEELAVVPRELWLHKSNAARSRVGPLLRTIQAQASRLPKHTSLLIFLVHERLLGADSFWAHYFEWLPQRYDELPLSWPPERREALLARHPGLGRWLHHEQWAYAETEFDLLRRVVFDDLPDLFPGGSAALRAAYDWAYCTIHSRGHSSGLSTGEELFAVIPFLDTPNHADDAGGTRGDLAQVPVQAPGAVGEAEGEAVAFRLVANRPYASGEELRISYDNATECHLEMLAQYGFSTPGRGPRGRDCFHITIEPEEVLSESAGGEEDYRYALVAAEPELGPRLRRVYSWSLREGETPRSALALLRLLLLPPAASLSATFQTALSAPGFSARDPIVSGHGAAHDSGHEAAVWEALGQVIRAHTAEGPAEGRAMASAEDTLVEEWAAPAAVGAARVGDVLQRKVKHQLRKLRRSKGKKKKNKKAQAEHLEPE